METVADLIAMPTKKLQRKLKITTPKLNSSVTIRLSRVIFLQNERQRRTFTSYLRICDMNEVTSKQLLYGLCQRWRDLARPSLALWSHINLGLSIKSSCPGLLPPVFLTYHSTLQPKGDFATPLGCMCGSLCTKFKKKSYSPNSRSFNPCYLC
jgi:hypothetical protein